MLAERDQGPNSPRCVADAEVRVALADDAAEDGQDVVLDGRGAEVGGRRGAPGGARSIIRRMLRRLPLVISPQPKGGFTVTSPVLPELVTEGDTLEEAFLNVRDALAAVVEIYAEEGRALPAGIELPPAGQVVWTDALVELA